MRRTAAATVLAFAAGLATAASAGAVPPERTVSEVYDADVTVTDEFLTTACGFKVTAQLSGHYRETAFFNKDGSLNRVTAHPSFRSTLTSSKATITTTDVGLDRFVENADGTISIFGTGVHLKLKDGPKAIGLWRLVVDPEAGELISEEYHGQFDVTAEGTVEAICDALS
jgi:hypothetical protein